LLYKKINIIDDIDAIIYNKRKTYSAMKRKEEQASRQREKPMG